jgi:hypothetical protein
MKFHVTTFACLWLLLAVNFASAQSKSDRCHVYVVDVKATQQFREKTDVDALMRKPKNEQEAIINAAGLGKTFDEFATKVGEEELTTRTFPFPNGKQVISASVFYTDESMVSTGNSDSMLLAISVGAKAYDDAISAPDAAVTEVSYDQNTDAVRAKRNIVVNGREYLVGLECRCKKDRTNEKK